MINTLSIWDKTSNLTNLAGEALSPAETKRRYGAANAGKVLIETNPNGQLVAIDDLYTWVGICGIDPTGMTDAEIVAAIIAHRDAPPDAGEAIAPDEIDEILNGGN